MSLLDLVRRRTQDVHYTRVLVCSVGDASDHALEDDFNAYRAHLESVRLRRFEDANGLVNALRDGYDIVHVLTFVAPDGTIDKSEMTGTELIQRATQCGTKLLWIGSSNEPQGYIKGFTPNGNRLNVVMTIDRRDDRLSQFVEKTLS